MSIFLSTPSVRRATAHHNPAGLQRENFYPRPPRGGRRTSPMPPLAVRSISIHALREEGDATLTRTTPPLLHFYPRPPRGGRRDGLATGSCGMHFYPRPPRGGRQLYTKYYVCLYEFLSTPSARRATFAFARSQVHLCGFLSTPSARRATTAGRCCGRCYAISIHALREEGDESGLPSVEDYLISIHALREEGDPEIPQYQAPAAISIHALREEGDSIILSSEDWYFYFYPRPPRGGRLGLIFKDIFANPFLSTPSARRATTTSRRCGRPGLSFLSTPSARRATA